MITHWIIPITGFTQHLGRPNGFDRLWLKLRPLASATTSLLPPQKWSACAEHLAEFIGRNSEQSGPQTFWRPCPDIVLICYSWGFGHAGLNLCRELGYRGFAVRHLVVCDGVFHSWRRPWRALLPAAKPAWAPSWLPYPRQPAITIPDNVRRVSWFRQTTNRPQGADLVAADPARTAIDEPVVLDGMLHEYMDDSRTFHARCLEVCRFVEGESDGRTGGPSDEAEGRR